MAGATAARSRQGEQRRADGARTREQLMDVAEQLFAESGVEGVSIRSINAAAGLAPASVHYHFGDKDGLLRAVITRRGNRLIEQQESVLADLERLRRRPTAEEAVRLLADPFFALLQAEPEAGGRWLGIIANLVATRNEPAYRIGFGPASIHDRVNAVATRAYPHLDPAEVAERWRLATTALLQLLAGEAALLGEHSPASVERFTVIVTFVAGGLDAACARPRR